MHRRHLDDLKKAEDPNSQWWTFQPINKQQTASSHPENPTAPETTDTTTSEPSNTSTDQQTNTQTDNIGREEQVSTDIAPTATRKSARTKNKPVWLADYVSH